MTALTRLSIVIGLMLALVCCGQDDQRNIYRFQQDLRIDEITPLPFVPYVNPAFRRYVSRFEAISGKSVMDHIVIDFGDTDGAAGVCLTKAYKFDMPRITISKKSWREFDQDHLREMIIFHELGHCVLNKEHRGDWGYIESLNLNAQFCAPLSMMYYEANFMLLSAYENNRDYYIRELLGKSVDETSFKIHPDNCFFSDIEVAGANILTF